MTFQEFATEVSHLITDLIPTIADDYRADEESSEPSMQITIGTDDKLSDWSYQTGDNSYTGGAYGFPYWGVTSLYRDDNPADIARELVNQIADQIAQTGGY